MRKYDHIFFDLDNTLWDFNTNSLHSLKQALKQTGILDKLESFDNFHETYEDINTSLWQDYREKRINKQSLTHERFSRTLNQFGLNSFDPDELNRIYLECMANQKGLFHGAHEVLEYLKNKGYLMHIITNGFKEVQNKKIVNSGLSGYINKIFISEEIQAPKPDREIFEHALKSTNASKKKSIMIGDSWEVDITGAQQFGMDQVMFLNGRENKFPLEITDKWIKSDKSHHFFYGKTKTYFIEKLTDMFDFF